MGNLFTYSDSWKIDGCTHPTSCGHPEIVEGSKGQLSMLELSPGPSLEREESKMGVFKAVSLKKNEEKAPKGWLTKNLKADVLPLSFKRGVGVSSQEINESKVPQNTQGFCLNRLPLIGLGIPFFITSRILKKNLLIIIQIVLITCFSSSIRAQLIVADVNELFAEQLKPLLQEMKRLESEEKEEDLFNTYIEVADLYEDWEAYDKAVVHLEKAVDLQEKLSDQEDPGLLERLAFNYRRAGKNREALSTFLELDAYYEDSAPYRKQVQVLEQITDIYRSNRQYEKALEYNKQILALNEAAADAEGQAISLNNIGFLYKFLNASASSLENFLKALQIRQALEQPPSAYTVLLNNIGIMYQNLGDHNSAMQYFQDAIAAIDPEEDPEELAQIQNLLAIVHMGRENYRDALRYNGLALELVQKHDFPLTTQEIYKTRADILERTNNFKPALLHYKRHAEIRDSLQAQIQFTSTSNLEKRRMIERAEQEMAILAVQKEIQELELRRASLETEKKEQQVELLLRNQELQDATIRQQQLEQARAQQELKLTQQELEAEKKDQEIVSLQKDRQIRELALEQQDLKQKERESQIALLESQQEVAELELQEAEQLRNIVIVGLVLALIILGLLARLGYARRRANHILRERKEELEEVLDDLKHAQSQLVDSEKMASLGQLTAGIAHELNNPIGFISSNIHALKTNFLEINELLKKASHIQENGKSTEALENFRQYYEQIDTPYLQKEIEELLGGIDRGASRSAEIVSGLKFFSHAEHTSFVSANLEDIVETALMLMRNQLKNTAEVYTDFGKCPNFYCMPGKLSQVCVNILSNAVQAMEETAFFQQGELGKIWIQTRQQGDQIELRIKDNGPGMDKELQYRIFEPFYTTKEIGKGTGLGLSISFGIIEQHKGRIEVNSNIGEGAEFIIKLPLDPEFGESKG